MENKIKENYGMIKFACYSANASLAVVVTVSPLLFLTFYNLYGISFSKLGTLVLTNFVIQLSVDLILSFYSHKFNIAKLIKTIPILTATGLLIYAVSPILFPNSVYIGLLIGTVIFAASGGLAEVLISPIIDHLPSDNPEREMSKLHSFYAWGVVTVVVVTTLFIMIFGSEYWQWVPVLWMIVPITSCILFVKSTIPELKTHEKSSNILSLIKEKDFIVCFICIFLGGASECTMSQWSSTYLEQSLNIPKVWGDIFGVAMFAVMLGIARTLYAKHGSDIYKTLAVSAVCTTVCYIIAVFSNIALIGLIACAMTGFCTAMMWPGCLVIASNKFPTAGVALFALMAAGGDLGCALGPQLVGSVADFAFLNDNIQNLTSVLNLSIEQLSMKIALLSATIFPILASILFIKNYLHNKNKSI